VRRSVSAGRLRQTFFELVWLGLPGTFLQCALSTHPTPPATGRYEVVTITQAFRPAEGREGIFLKGGRCHAVERVGVKGQVPVQPNQ
jgi:hypothetical protein